jgi:ADP-ribosylglycohydrolase
MFYTTDGPFIDSKGVIHNDPYGVEGLRGQFQLKLGQWTDDTSMGLCMADSLIISKGYSGSNIRIFFWNWLQVIISHVCVYI